MTFYIGVVDRSAEGAWGLWFPDCPGCTAMGDDVDALYANAIAALRDWSDVDEAPRAAPRPLQDLLEDADVAAILREDKASFLQVPLVRDAHKPVRANISIDAGLLEAIDAAAGRLRVTRSAYLAQAARDRLVKAG